jgi:hypothetical protein
MGIHTAIPRHTADSLMIILQGGKSFKGQTGFE